VNSSNAELTPADSVPAQQLSTDPDVFDFLEHAGKLGFYVSLVDDRHKGCLMVEPTMRCRLGTLRLLGASDEASVF